MYTNFDIRHIPIRHPSHLPSQKYQQSQCPQKKRKPPTKLMRRECSVRTLCSVIRNLRDAIKLIPTFTQLTSRVFQQKKKVSACHIPYVRAFSVRQYFMR